MRGRKPKDPAVRRRKNKASTAAVLDLDAAEQRAVPTLPRALFAGGQVQLLTKRWWKTIWRSPMASRWLPADIEGLYLIAVLRNEFFLRPAANIAAEIRQQETRFGLDVLSRRRLDWRIGAEPPKEAVPEQALPAPDQRDPRSVLRAVK